jgi:hypothetical protein
MTRYSPTLFIRLLGALSVIVSLATWGMDILHVVEPCGYCRVQRTIIGFLGMLLLLPVLRHWFAQYLAKVLAAFGVVVAATQHFSGWNDISKGQFHFVTPLYANSFLLSAGALFVIIAQLLFIERAAPRASI